MPADNIRANETVRGREHHTRDKAFRIVLDGLHVQKGDWIIVSDIDEIFRPTILQTMRAPDPGASPMDEIFVDRLVSQGGSWVISFGLRYYRYAYDVYLGTRSTPVAMRYREQASHLERVALSGMEGVMYKKSKELFTRIGENDWATKGQQIRNCGGAAGHAMKVDDAGWRCSWCFGNMSQFLAKMDTYNHREYDTSEHRRKPSITVSTGTINFIEWAVLDHRFVDFLLPWDNGSGGNAYLQAVRKPGETDVIDNDLSRCQGPNESLAKKNEIAGKQWIVTVVVADTKTPKDWGRGSCVFLSVEEQQCLGFGIVPATPFKSYSRKNVDYLWAIKQGATTVFDIDEDFKHDRKFTTDPARLTKFLTKWTSASIDLETSIVELMDAMRVREFIGKADVDLAQRWIKDLQSVGYVFPKVTTLFNSKAVE
ncbi:hypothetical protein CPB97_011121 [Podila verticillata]|nr:hypothetical protein CPB97_011121 [Podila verticillata]